nr:HAMP domain-containing protein [Micromonospora sp. DSM 115978]
AGPGAPVDDLAVYDVNGVEVAASGAEIPIRPADVAAVRRDEVVVRWPDEVGQPRIVLAVPVHDDGEVVGVVAMARSDEPLRYTINRRWINLAVGGGFAAVGAVLMAALLARWVSRPLRRLESAAAELGSGQLATRARAVHGPSEVRELAATFDVMAARIETLVDGQRAFLADVSHQLRTPLTAMRLRLELLEGDVDGAAADDVAG